MKINKHITIVGLLISFVVVFWGISSSHNGLGKTIKHPIKTLPDVVTIKGTPYTKAIYKAKKQKRIKELKNKTLKQNDKAEVLDMLEYELERQGKKQGDAYIIELNGQSFNDYIIDILSK